ncbi:MAG: sodium:proton antiporter NhaD [Pyrinomonadaceae bacterium]
MELAIIIIFTIGYLAIAFEHPLKINKAASALVTGVLCWTAYVFSQADKDLVSHALLEHLGEISGILFFLLGAMTIVELIDANDGFQIITERITTKSTIKLIWIIGVISFFLSAALDNLTTTIVMVTMLRKIVADREKRLLLAGITIIAANAGGAWSPVGDVSTTMLWIGGQITTMNTIAGVFLPSVVCLLVPLLYVSFRVRGSFESPDEDNDEITTLDVRRNIIFFLGLAVFIFVPIFKSISHLPPFMGMLLGLGFMWLVTEVIHKREGDKEKGVLSVVYALRRIDTPSILFFLGILLSVSALQSTGQLSQLAGWLARTILNETTLIVILGLLSAVIDNVPLVAAAQGMYTLQQYPTDSYFWQFLAYAAGTGGSSLIIGSAAGVAAMGLEKIDFFWYVKRISLLALLGYLAGAIVYVVQYSLTSTMGAN